MSVKAYLFDADGNDHAIDPDASVVQNIGDNQLLWVDITGNEEREITDVGALFSLHPEAVNILLKPIGRPLIQTFDTYFQLNVAAVKEVDDRYTPLGLDIVSGANYVVTVHTEPIEFLDEFEQHIRGDTQLGQLDAASLVAALLDWHLTSYYAVLDRLESSVDRLDEKALTNRASHKFLNELVGVRRHVAELRRLLAPHRQVFAALASPDFELIASTASAAHFRVLVDRLDHLIEAVENGRDMVIGTFELFSTSTAQSTNDTVRFLTVITVVIGLAGVIAGIMGMNFSDAPFFHTGTVGLLTVIGGIIILSAATLAVARWRQLF